MVLSSLYEFSTRRFAAPAESGGEASAFISLDVKKHAFFAFWRKNCKFGASTKSARAVLCKADDDFLQKMGFCTRAVKARRLRRLYTPC
jgi:diaminopimelate decarboxylase